MAPAEKIPPIKAPMYKKVMDVAMANNPNQTAIPAIPSRITGRRPHRSVSAPMIGENRTVVNGARAMTSPN
jgi:hypothetical protein